MAIVTKTGSPTDYQQDGRSNTPRVQRRRSTHFSEAVTAAQTPNPLTATAAGATFTVTFPSVALGTDVNTGLSAKINGAQASITNVTVATGTDLVLTIAPAAGTGDIVQVDYDGQFEYLRDTTAAARRINSFSASDAST